MKSRQIDTPTMLLLQGQQLAPLERPKLRIFTGISNVSAVLMRSRAKSRDHTGRLPLLLKQVAGNRTLSKTKMGLFRKEYRSVFIPIQPSQSKNQSGVSNLIAPVVPRRTKTPQKMKKRIDDLIQSSDGRSEGDKKPKTEKEIEEAHLRIVDRLKKKQLQMLQEKKIQTCEIMEQEKELRRQQNEKYIQLRKSAAQRRKSNLRFIKVKRAKIAICGAGPVGLFLAISIQLRYGTVTTSYNSDVKYVVSPECPDITIFEKRDKSSWGTRTQTISVQSSVQTLLSRILPQPNNFSPTCAINVLEKRFRAFLENVLQVSITQREITSNKDLLSISDFDCIIWAGGKSSPPKMVREELDMPVTCGQSENALIFDFNCDGKPEESLKKTRANSGQRQVEILSHNVHRVHPGDRLRLLVRPPINNKSQGLFWIIGIEPDVFNHCLEADPTTTYPSMVESLRASVVKGCHTDAQIRLLMQICKTLEERSGQLRCNLKTLVASHFRSRRVSTRLEVADKTIPLLLVGDAAFGKPFYTGSTLNNHIQDVYFLAQKSDWSVSALQNFGVFDAYERHFCQRVSAPRFSSNVS